MKRLAKPCNIHFFNGRIIVTRIWRSARQQQHGYNVKFHSASHKRMSRLVWDAEKRGWERERLIDNAGERYAINFQFK